MPDGSQSYDNGDERLALAGPTPDGTERLDRAAEVQGGAATHPVAMTETNGDEAAHAGSWPAQFTKGLQHDEHGLLENPDDYAALVQAINTQPDARFGGVAVRRGAPERFRTAGPGGAPLRWRPWDGPRAGHAYALAGPDAATLALPPAPQLGSAEQTAEMGEVYGLALLRDVAFTDIALASTVSGPAGVSPSDVLGALNYLPFFREGAADADLRAWTRRADRFPAGDDQLTGRSFCRGAGPGSGDGPFLSQFLLAGDAGQPASGRVALGVQALDQRIAPPPAGVDFMGDWWSWLDVQNGADTAALLAPDGPPRFIATPRDLAAYGRSGTPCQAFRTAAQILVSHGTALAADAAEPGRGTGHGAPEVLALLGMAASAALTAVHRQKFNHHRRCRPERIGGLLTLARNGHGTRLAAAEAAVARMGDELGESGLLDWVAAANAWALARPHPVQGRGNPPGWLRSYLVPMAFPEGAPMHPGYGAAQAAVAGACATVLKALFDLYGSDADWAPRRLAAVGMTQVFVAEPDGGALRTITPAAPLTLSGEIDKLASNIAFGRLMAGVSFYSDVHAGLRLGERIAVGLLQEWLRCRPAATALRLVSFEGDRLRLTSEWTPQRRLESSVTLSDSREDFADWWLRHGPALRR